MCGSMSPVQVRAVDYYGAGSILSGLNVTLWVKGDRRSFGTDGKAVMCLARNRNVGCPTGSQLGPHVRTSLLTKDKQTSSSNVFLTPTQQYSTSRNNYSKMCEIGNATPLLSAKVGTKLRRQVAVAQSV
jgi:hypothetical protein